MPAKASGSWSRASWCGPSQAEIPNVVEAYKKYHDHGLDIVAFSFDCDMDEWMDAIKCWEMPWTHLNGDGEPGMVYDVVAIPDNVLIDPEGTVVARGLRGEQLGEFLSRVIPVTEPVSAKAMVCDETGCNTVEESAQDGPAPVDLGLSVCWWPFNVGATKESEYGSYFAFGEIRPKSDYYWSTYQFHTEGNRDVNVEFSKYNTQVGRGVLDRKTVLEMEDDAADAVLAHGLKEIAAADDVVVEVEFWLAHRLADECVGGEMHHGVRLERADGGADCLRIAKIAYRKWDARGH